MYFDNTVEFDIRKNIVNSDDIIAHTLDEKVETLKEHSDLSIKCFKSIIIDKNLDKIFYTLEDRLLKKFSELGKNLYKELLYNTIYTHDLGKINCNFQYKKMSNNKFKNKKGLKFNNSNHSMLSAIIYINHYFNKIIKHNIKVEKDYLTLFMIFNSYIISKHHGSLDSISDFKKKLSERGEEGRKLYEEQYDIFNENYTEPLVFNKKKNLVDIIFKKIDKLITQEWKEEESINLYIYTRFLSSLLLASDYYATSEFKGNESILDVDNPKDLSEFYKIYKKNNIYKSIRNYEKNHLKKDSTFQNIDDINILRNEMFLEAERELFKNKFNNIFYLEAPTGSGKSNVGFNLSFKLIEYDSSINKIFYVYPFNTLIEQNIKTLKDIFNDKKLMRDIQVINSITPIRVEKKTMNEIDEKEESDTLNNDYNKSLLQRQFIHYPIVLTTHISMFRYLFSSYKTDLFPLHQIANSVIVLDEIQSYKNSIWKDIIVFLDKYSQLLNIKLIIMSATLPELGKLLKTKKNTVHLIKNREKYFNNKIFKNRVLLNYGLLDIKITKEILLDKVITLYKEKKGKLLIEFIDKKSAMDFYHSLNEKKEELFYNEGLKCQDIDIDIITGDDNRADKNKLIKKVKEKENILLVATQVIEAGVDIDMDNGFKDISLLDSEEQFLGRINRSCKKENSEVYFFNLTQSSLIYKNDIRKDPNITLENKDMRKILKNKDFYQYYNSVFKYLNAKSSGISEESYDYFIKNKVNKLKYNEINNRMQLIDDSYSVNVFLNREVILENGDILIGENVWREYVEILENFNIDYAEKTIKLSLIKSKLNYFIYSVRNNYFTYSDKVGDLFYIEDGMKYFTDEGKFNRESFECSSNDIFI